MKILSYASRPALQTGFSLVDYANSTLALIVICSGSLAAWLISDHYPGNHIDADIRPLIFIPLVALVWFIAAGVFCIARPRLTWTFAFISAIVVAGFLVADHLNLMDDYDVWTSRGMPDCWVISR